MGRAKATNGDQAIFYAMPIVCFCLSPRAYSHIGIKTFRTDRHRGKQKRTEERKGERANRNTNRLSEYSSGTDENGEEIHTQF